MSLHRCNTFSRQSSGNVDSDISGQYPFCLLLHLANLKKKEGGWKDGSMLRALAVLAEFSAPMPDSSQPCHSSYRDLVPSFGPRKHCTPHMHILTCRCKHINKNKKVNLKRKEGKKKKSTMSTRAAVRASVHLLSPSQFPFFLFLVSKQGLPSYLPFVFVSHLW